MFSLKSVTVKELKASIYCLFDIKQKAQFFLKPISLIPTFERHFKLL